jgi:hypothetical protein
MNKQRLYGFSVGKLSSIKADLRAAKATSMFKVT